MKTRLINNRALLVTSLLLLTIGAVNAAPPITDAGGVLPKQLPENPTPAVPASGPTTTAPVKNPSQVLIKKVRALIFVPSPEAVKSTPTHAEGVVLQDVTVPDEKDFRTMVTPYVGASLTRGKLNQLIGEIIGYYREHDRPVVDVIVPEQEITDGTLQLVLLEGKVGAVKVTGNRWFSSSEISDGFTVKSGAPISAPGMQDELDWVNNNPFRISELVYTPGDKMGDTNLVLQTHDRFPVRPYVGYQNSGNAFTGINQWYAGFQYGDLFGLGQQLSYQYTSAGDGDGLRANSGSYVIPLPWHNTLSFFGSYTTTKGQLPPFINLDGRSYQISARYNVPLPTVHVPSLLTLKESISAGFDYKYNNNSLEFGGTAMSASLYTIDQFVLAYNATETDRYGETSINEQLFMSPGNLGTDNSDASFSGAHTGATSNYVYNTLVLERLTKLPADFTLVLRGTVQNSSTNLAPSEQLGFGGFDSVRGYDEREVNADNGYIFTTELRAPTVSIGEALGHPEFKDQLQFLGFWDYGSASNHTPLPGESVQTALSGIGMGLRYSVGTYFSLRYDYGFQLLRTGLDNDHGNRSDIGVVLSY